MKKRMTFMLIMLAIAIPLSAQNYFATVLKSTGAVMIKPNGETEFNVTAEMGMGLHVGDAIMTADDGFIAVIFTNDKSLVKIRKNSEVTIREYNNVKTVKINEGRVLAAVTPGAKGSFRVETPTSVASVKGTEFWTVVSQLYGDRFYGVEGIVNVLNLITGIESDMSPGQMVISTPQGQLVNMPVDESEIPQDIEEEKAPGPEEPGVQPEEQAAKPGEQAAAQGQMAVAPVGTTPESPVAEGVEPETGGGGGGSPLGMGLGLGSVTIDDKIYNQIALRPELRLGKLAVALDVAIYMDEQGKIRKDEWDEASDYLDKLYYVRWGQQGDPFFAKLGAMDNVTMGYGILLNGYSNTTEYPQVRKVGLHTGMKLGSIGWEAFVANAKELSGPGLLAARLTYQPLQKLPITFGGTYVADLNQYKGLKDTDEDNVPDVFDAFPALEFKLPRYYAPGAFGYEPGEVLKGKDYDIDSDGDGIPDQLDFDMDGDGMTDHYPLDPTKQFDPDTALAPDPFNTEEQKIAFSGAAVDVGYPLINMKAFKLLLYSQAATLISEELTAYPTGEKFTPGMGFTIPGLRMNMFKIINLTVEYRMAGENFLFGFWDRAYDYERVSIRQNLDGSGSLFPYTKEELKLMNKPASGVFGALDINVFNFVTLGSYYQHMTTEDAEIKSFMASASVPAGKIPKLADATAFYIRNNDADPFNFKEPSENTILGYKVGFEIGGGAVIYYVFQKTYRDYNGDGMIDPDTESISITTIETGFNF